MKTSVVSVLVLAMSLFAVDAVPQPQAGQLAPDFTLPSQDGTKVSLHDFRGKWVILYFYPKDGTTGCTIEAHNFQRDLAKYEQYGAVILGVSVDSTSSHQEFCTKQGLRFKLLADTEKSVSRQYGSLTNLLGYRISSRNTFLVNPEGRIAKVWTGVDPGQHSVEVLATLAKMAR
ncbi:peroxiredoxin [Bryobacter aggregatus]|uniref:peroxiredoxin n=1 Tax=Bryobacter aggregatus TaxID=360054 RepID=UPI0004E27050|nr:peroxiredoxin [Bryobacter aggregatus]